MTTSVSALRQRYASLDANEHKPSAGSFDTGARFSVSELRRRFERPTTAPEPVRIEPSRVVVMKKIAAMEASTPRAVATPATPEPVLSIIEKSETSSVEETVEVSEKTIEVETIAEDVPEVPTVEEPSNESPVETEAEPSNESALEQAPLLAIPAAAAVVVPPQEATPKVEAKRVTNDSKIKPPTVWRKPQGSKPTPVEVTKPIQNRVRSYSASKAMSRAVHPMPETRARSSSAGTIPMSQLQPRSAPRASSPSHARSPTMSSRSPKSPSSRLPEDLSALWQKNAREMRERLLKVQGKALKFEMHASYRARLAESQTRRAKMSSTIVNACA
ncbi:hypothetical protein Poli38472_011652 [Pythium oligandrum]|uniref:Uncharacterized protein n=1 Tax=Pythium oligandrum TaxID=41045 RepID=A0A8K1FME2_PYTOL|nr:hypothetical protein Poli38472_011652 [Pythium oligandrum]|eukprot:TMW64772.1 hypothetical protein Poli38472_011652 [Pythium oligandrum]